MFDLTEGTSSADWRGFRASTGAGTHWECVVFNGVPTMILVEAAFNYHWGDKSLDRDQVSLGRTDILAVRAAAANGQAAFDAAIANTAAASSYATMCAAATVAGVTGPQHPANVERLWWVHCAADYPLT